MKRFIAHDHALVSIDVTNLLSSRFLSVFAVSMFLYDILRNERIGLGAEDGGWGAWVAKAGRWRGGRRRCV